MAKAETGIQRTPARAQGQFILWSGARLGELLEGQKRQEGQKGARRGKNFLPLFALLVFFALKLPLSLSSLSRMN
jgi:hypothetical protein